MRKAIEWSWRKIFVTCGTLTFAGVVLIGGNVYAAEEVIYYSPQSPQSPQSLQSEEVIYYSPQSPQSPQSLQSGQSNVTADERMKATKEKRKDAKGRMPKIDGREDLPEGIQKMLESPESGNIESQAWGNGMYPFTTKRAGTSTRKYTKSSLKKELWRGVGKLWLRFSSGWFVCTASLIDKGLLVTAAHCVHDYGQENNGWVEEIIFEPTRHDKYKPYGAWKGVGVLIPGVYFFGTDTCTVPGVICENDVAIVILKKKGRKHLGQRVFTSRDIRKGPYFYGSYNYGVSDYSYVPFVPTELGWSAQITQFGYPIAMDSGYRMIRTDSLGIWQDPSNVIIGSDQTGGSSGGPWFVNFGLDYESTSSTPAERDMSVMAVTSWGYTNSTIKIVGASRFSTNTTFTSESNIEILHSDACVGHPDSCY